MDLFSDLLRLRGVLLEYGELMKTMRLERGITQKQLTDGITSRTTLANFEAGISRPSFEVIVSYLDRLNVDINEFLFLTNSNRINDKQTVSNYFEQVNIEGNKHKLRIFIKVLEKKYLESQDIFYLYMYVYSKNLLSKNCDFSKLEKKDEKYIVELMAYLNKCETWGAFELQMFCTILFIFPKEYINHKKNYVLKKLKQYTKYKNYRYSSNKNIINLVIVCLKYKLFEIIPECLALIERDSRSGRNFYELVIERILKEIYVRRRDKTKTNIIEITYYIEILSMFDEQYMELTTKSVIERIGMLLTESSTIKKHKVFDE